MSVSMHLPRDAIDVVWRFFDAVIEDDRVALASLFIPDSDAALMQELFGTPALIAASGMLRGPCIIRIERLLALEGCIWLEGKQLSAESEETLGHVVFRVEPFGERWRISEILPWRLEAVHYLTERPDPRTDDSVAIMLLSVGLSISPSAQLDSVEQMLVETMRNDYYPVTVITRAVRMWRDFKKAGAIEVLPDGAWAAAIHRAATLLCLLDAPIERFALTYQVEVSEARRAYNEVINTLRITYFDERYSPIPDPNELVRHAKRMGAMEDVEITEHEMLPEEPEA
ncbi:MAG: hypothetical protein RMK18_08200 [Armatimonadota bacterium]|nr:hypothetical protein [Armatimonadota bacterium]MCX7777831.1 hypothetical protein [Armatimonadota bacterium]MDW8025822.1 hypothetical protein [Armatimonadota bacterium]